MTVDFAGPDPALSLYLHIPFCRHRCSYCDFNTYTGLNQLKDAYAAALGDEIIQVSGGVRRPAHSVFLGGGTPSLMSLEALTQILETIRRHFELTADVEITMEANPDTVNRHYLATARELGINRISFGAQSANALELKLLEREHTFDSVVDAVQQSRMAGFDNLSLDLIYGLPGQTLASWEYSLQSVLSLSPEHLSLYCLTIEPGTPMHRWLDSGRIIPPDPDLAADQYDLACELLNDHSYVHYEISNWAQEGHECRHNLTYWRNDEYLGFGAGAHGHADGYRYSTVKQPRVYIRRLKDGAPGHYPLSAAVAHKYRVSRTQAISDTIITQLRLLKEGLNLTDFITRFGEGPAELYPETVEQLLDFGLIHQSEDRLLLTKRGRFLSNQVFYRFV